MPTNVWASHTGAGLWEPDPTGSSHDYGYLVTFGAFADLPTGLAAQRITNITRLAIVAHGDSPGVVVVGPRLTPTSVSSFAATFGSLTTRLESTAKVVFFSCIAGKGPEGTSLLTLMSLQLPGRRVIGFELWGEYSASLPNAPGVITACSAPTPTMSCFPTARHGRLSPWGQFSKWAVDGVIVRYPVLEQNGRPGLRCANPACRGHVSPANQCSRWHPACEW
jgi:hypothetical protein